METRQRSHCTRLLHFFFSGCSPGNQAYVNIPCRNWTRLWRSLLEYQLVGAPLFRQLCGFVTRGWLTFCFKTKWLLVTLHVTNTNHGKHRGRLVELTCLEKKANFFSTWINLSPYRLICCPVFWFPFLILRIHCLAAILKITSIYQFFLGVFRRQHWKETGIYIGKEGEEFKGIGQ